MTTKEHSSTSTFSTVAKQTSNANLKDLSEVAEFIENYEEAQTRLNLSFDQLRNMAIYKLTGEISNGSSLSEKDANFYYKIARPTQLEEITSLIDLAIDAIDAILIQSNSYNDSGT